MKEALRAESTLNRGIGCDFRIGSPPDIIQIGRVYQPLEGVPRSSKQQWRVFLSNFVAALWFRTDVLGVLRTGGVPFSRTRAQPKDSSPQAVSASPKDVEARLRSKTFDPSGTMSSPDKLQANKLDNM